MNIILASTSPYRRSLLERLQLRFSCIPPDVDEEPHPEEVPQALAERLARAKACAVADLHPDALVIGSDQVASIGERIMGKPGNHENAKAQLRMSSNNEVTFYTGIALVSRARHFERVHVEPFSVRFRALDDTHIEDYLQREQPYDCAGSFKAEGLGIALFEQLTGSDPTSLEGLPLITLTSLLAAAGVDVLRIADR
jgi:7-methyl-GTP pyrophosphatase